MAPYDPLRRLKLPALEAADVIASRLRAHWSAATRAPVLRRFGTAAGVNWQRVRAITTRLEAGVHHLASGGRLIR